MSARERWGESLRIIWTIAAKDIVDSIKNKVTLSTLCGVLFMIVIYRILPSWENGNTHRLAVYDAGDSRLVAELENSTQFDLYQASSQQEMEIFLGHRDAVVLGLAIPAGFDLESGRLAELSGYVVHWASDSAIVKAQVFFEEQLTKAAGRPVRINVAGNTVYTQKDSRGYAFLAAISVIFSITMIGISVVPTLMVEEQQTRTMDVLLVSPASIGQVVSGKALAGLFYCLMATAVALAFNTSVITHWGLALLAATCGSLFIVALGLLMGSAIQAQQQLVLWAWFFLFPLMAAVFLSVLEDILPESLISLLSWMPTVALSKVLRVSFAADAPLAQFGPELALVGAYAALTLLAVGWVVRRSDR